MKTAPLSSPPRWLEEQLEWPRGRLLRLSGRVAGVPPVDNYRLEVVLVLELPGESELVIKVHFKALKPVVLRRPVLGLLKHGKGSNRDLQGIGKFVYGGERPLHVGSPIICEGFGLFQGAVGLGEGGRDPVHEEGRLWLLLSEAIQKALGQGPVKVVPGAANLQRVAAGVVD